MPALHGNSQQKAIFWNCSVCKTVLHIIGNLPRHTLTHDLYATFKILYLRGFITELCRQQTTVILNNENANFHNIGQGEAWYMKYERHKLGGSQAYGQSLVYTVVISLGIIWTVSIICCTKWTAGLRKWQSKRKRKVHMYHQHIQGLWPVT